MAKAPWLNLNNRQLGMSTDEYSGGSFLYSQNINVSKNSKSFKISDYIVSTDISYSSWNIIALTWPYNSNYPFWFSDDWYIESDTTYNWFNLSRDIWWPLYKRTTWYVNAIKLWWYTYAFTADKLDLITGDLYTWIFAESRNVVTNPSLTSNNWWTINAWWTTWVNWATHTTGTDRITQAITVDWTNKQRIAINVTWHTTGTCVVKLDNSTVAWTISSTSPNWNTFIIDNPSGTRTTIDLVPSTTFNWTIQYVSVWYLTGIELEKLSITSATTHPLLEDWEILYVGAWAKVDTINISAPATPILENTFSIVDRTHTIFSIQKIWQSIVLFSTNNEDTKISYRDGISSAPSEVITWKDKVWTNAIVDGNLAYVLCENWYRKELYVMSGYDKKLIALGKRNDHAFGYDKEVYRLEQRNDFYNNPLRTNAMWFSGNKLLIPAYNWLYTYWFENPNWVNALTKEWVVDTDTISATANIWWLMYIAYKTKSTPTTNRIAYVRPYSNLSGKINYLVTNPILRDNFSSKKQLNRFRIGYILPSQYTSIDLYVSANNNYFRTFTVSWVTTTPTAWAIYYTEYSSPYNLYEVISTNIVAWAGTISCRMTNYVWPYTTWWTLTKVSWVWDATISRTDSDNFIHLKNISATTYTAWEDLIFWQEFLQAYMPDWHTIQLKIQLNSTRTYNNPEVFDIPILAEIVWQNG